jgi:hypothetical protein
MNYAPRSAYGKALALLQQADERPLELAEYLWTVHFQDQLHSKALAGKKPNRIADLVKQGAIKRRKAYYLIKVWSRFSGIPKSKLARVGWTKLSTLASKCPAGKEEWGIEIALTEGVTAQNLAAKLKPASDAAETRRVILEFNLDDYEVFKVTLVDHGAKPKGKGLTGKEQAILSIIIASWGPF